LNIIINAEKEMRLAHGRGQLVVKTEQIGDYIRIVFEDDGPGIAEENMDKIFNPFFTTREVGNSTGLGLSISHAIVTEHDGRIYARSRFGHGATFFVEVPIFGEETQREAGKMSRIEKPTRGRILVIDDEAAILDYMSQALSGAGYEVQTAADTALAKRFLLQLSYDLILLDIKMPQVNGIEFYEDVEKTVPGLQKKVIVITGDVMGEETKVFISRTGVAYLTKPLETAKLLSEIERILGGET
jgi:CheY-like chemotaxis protein